MLRNFHYARTMCEALREGLTASHQYEHLRSRSIPHKTALNEALGIGVTPEAQTRTVAPLLSTTKGLHEGIVHQNRRGRVSSGRLRANCGSQAVSGSVSALRMA
jgi:hypothetical protein